MADFVVRRWDLAPYPGDQAPPHIHHKGDEAFCVIEGRLEVLVGDRRRALGPGDYAFIPAGTIHTFATLGDETARVIVVMTPQIDALVQALHAPGTQDWDSVWERHDSEMVQLDDQDRRI